jgi:hypothetical protein
MITKSKSLMKFVVYAVALSFLLTGPVSAGMTMKHGAGHGMAMHHQHAMLNHALGMTIEGSNMIMLGQMGMAGGIDKVSIDHGKMMMKNGRTLWDELMSGDTMMKMHSAGASPTEDSMMNFTHEFASAQLKVIDLLKQMSAADQGMAMHHQHMMLNHALKMALEGSNLVMLGQMGMAPGIDAVSVEHGKHMLKNANKLFHETMSGSAMMDMHSEGVSPEKDKHMAYTHKIAEAYMKVINMLKMMPSVM